MSSSTRSLRIETARVFAPLLQPARYKGAHGGRGSGKSHFFAGLMVERAMLQPGFRGVCIREVQKSLKESAKRLIEDKIAQHGLGAEFEIQEAQINTPGSGVVIFQGMQDHTSESIKSLEGFDIAWAEEAQSLSQRSLTLLRPTIRKENSELWFSWNRTRRNDPVDLLLTGDTPPTNSIVVKANWSDNPWFPSVLEQERADDFRDRPDEYEHIWGGDYASVTEGAYFAQQMARARREGRIGVVPVKTKLPVNTFWDIGINDTTNIWLHQHENGAERFVAYYCNDGQGLAHYINWLKDWGQKNEIVWGKHYGPHDIDNREFGSGLTRKQQALVLGFSFTVVPRVMLKANAIEAVRGVFSGCYFDAVACAKGIEHLDAYRKEWIEELGVWKDRPRHDEASHGADAFMTFATGFRPPPLDLIVDKYRRDRSSGSSTGYMAV